MFEKDKHSNPILPSVVEIVAQMDYSIISDRFVAIYFAGFSTDSPNVNNVNLQSACMVLGLNRQRENILNAVSNMHTDVQSDYKNDVKGLIYKFATNVHTKDQILVPPEDMELLTGLMILITAIHENRPCDVKLKMMKCDSYLVEVCIPRRCIVNAYEMLRLFLIHRRSFISINMVDIKLTIIIPKLIKLLNEKNSTREVPDDVTYVKLGKRNLGTTIDHSATYKSRKLNHTKNRNH